MKDKFVGFLVSIGLLIFATSCTHSSKSNTKLEKWIQSIEKEDFSSYRKSIAHYPDSVYNSFKKEYTELSSKEYKLIQKINNSTSKSIALAKEDELNFAFLKHLHNPSNEHLNIRFIPLDSLNPFRHYILLVDVNSDWEKTIQFFTENHKLGEYKASIKTILETERFDDTTLIIGQVFQSGTGVYWLQNHFFQFTKNSVRPVLQTVSSSYESGWGCMDYGVHATIISKKPFKIAYNKQVEFKDSMSNTIKKHEKVDTVLFVWNAKKMKYQPAQEMERKCNNTKSFYVGTKLEYRIHSNLNWYKPLLQSDEGLWVLNQLYKIK